jgi:hypothetical protein
MISEMIWKRRLSVGALARAGKLLLKASLKLIVRHRGRLLSSMSEVAFRYNAAESAKAVSDTVSNGIPLPFMFDIFLPNCIPSPEVPLLIPFYCRGLSAESSLLLFLQCLHIIRPSSVGPLSGNSSCLMSNISHILFANTITARFRISTQVKSVSHPNNGRYNAVSAIFGSPAKRKTQVPES